MKYYLRLLAMPLLFLVLFISLFILWDIIDLPSNEELIQLVQNAFDKYGLPAVLLGSFLEGILLVGNYFWVYQKSRLRDCAPETACHPQGSLSRASRGLYWTSLALYFVAFYVAYLSVPVMRLLEG